MISRQEAPSVAVISPCHSGRKPCQLLSAAREHPVVPSSFPGSVRHSAGVRALQTCSHQNVAGFSAQQLFFI